MKVTLGSEVVEPALDLVRLAAGSGQPEGTVISYFFTGDGNPLAITLDGSDHSIDSISGGNKQATLNALTLQVLSGSAQVPYMVLQPANQTNVQGTTATFTCLAGGSQPPIRYRWYFGTSQLAGQTNATLNISNIQPASASPPSYFVVASTGAGSVTSSVATLTINQTVGYSLIYSNGPTTITGLDEVGDFEPRELLRQRKLRNTLHRYIPFTYATVSGMSPYGPNGSPNFGTSLDAVNMSYIGRNNIYGNGIPISYSIPTTVGRSYKLQIILHDNFASAVGARLFQVQADSPLQTLISSIDLATIPATANAPTNVCLSVHLHRQGHFPPDLAHWHQAEPHPQRHHASEPKRGTATFPPNILTQPASRTVFPGQNVNFQRLGLRRHRRDLNLPVAGPGQRRVRQSCRWRHHPRINHQQPNRQCCGLGERHELSGHSNRHCGLDNQFCCCALNRFSTFQDPDRTLGLRRPELG